MIDAAGATHVPDPESRNVWPSIGMNSQSYLPLFSVSFKTPYVLFSNTSLFAWVCASIVERVAAGAHDELPDAASVGPAVGILGREAFVDMVVPVDHHIDAVLEQRDSRRHA